MQLGTYAASLLPTKVFALRNRRTFPLWPRPTILLLYLKQGPRYLFLQKWAYQWQRSHLTFLSVSASGDTTAGIIVLIRKDFLVDYRIKHTFGVIFAGRVCWLMLESPRGPPLYILACHIEKSPLE